MRLGWRAKYENSCSISASRRREPFVASWAVCGGRGAAMLGERATTSAARSAHATRWSPIQRFVALAGGAAASRRCRVRLAHAWPRRRQQRPVQLAHCHSCADTRCARGCRGPDADRHRSASRGDANGRSRSGTRYTNGYSRSRGGGDAHAGSCSGGCYANCTCRPHAASQCNSHGHTRERSDCYHRSSGYADDRGRSPDWRRRRGIDV